MGRIDIMDDQKKSIIWSEWEKGLSVNGGAKLVH
jgi:hypothetical protein